MDPIEQELTMLSTIRQEGNISAAAKRMFLSQPALSQRLTGLEKKIGFKIFRRDIPRRTEFTFEGQLYFNKLLQMRDLNRNFENRLLEISQNNYGSISLAMSSMRSQQMLPQLLLALKEQLPHLEFKLVYGSTRPVLDEMLASGAVDFNVNSVISNQFVQHELNTASQILAVPMSHTVSKAWFCKKHWMDKEPLSLHSFENDLFITSCAGQGGRDLAETTFQMHHFVPKNILEIFDYYTMLQLVQSGIGVAIISEAYASSFYSQMDICYFRLLHSPRSFTYLNHRKGLEVTPTIKQFISLCKSSAQNIEYIIDEKEEG